jgi:hypothetical protein
VAPTFEALFVITCPSVGTAIAQMRDVLRVKGVKGVKGALDETMEAQDGGAGWRRRMEAQDGGAGCADRLAYGPGAMKKPVTRAHIRSPGRIDRATDGAERVPRSAAAHARGNDPSERTSPCRVMILSRHVLSQFRAAVFVDQAVEDTGSGAV